MDEGGLGRRSFMRAAVGLGATALGAGGAEAAEKAAQKVPEIYPGYGEDAKTLHDKAEELKTAGGEDAKRLAHEVRDLMNTMADKMSRTVDKLGLKK